MNFFHDSHCLIYESKDWAPNEVGNVSLEDDAVLGRNFEASVFD